MNIRELNENDYEQYLQLIIQFKKTFFNKIQFITLLNLIKKTSEIWIIELNNKIIATGTIIFEYKFIHDISMCAHIEDICVDEKFIGQNYGKKIVEHLIKQSENKGCYKVILDCDEKLYNFYNKCGLEKKNIQMCKYF
jgi:glucosamine-phosphate N-acetyltransferase